MSILTLLILIILLGAVLPNWSYSASWGYAPSVIVGLILLTLILLLVLKILPW